MEKISIELKKTMAENIERQLQKAKKTQREMCKALDFKENTVSDWLNAKTYPRIDKIEMMANFFGCKKSELIESHFCRHSNNLSVVELALLSDFRSLNAGGQGKAAEYVNDLTGNPKYKANSSAATPETETPAPGETEEDAAPQSA